MDDRDYKKFYEGMRRAAILSYFKKEDDKAWDDLVLLMFDELKNYSIEEIFNALNYLSRTQKYFPTLSDIINSIDGTPEVRAVRSWNLMLRVFERLNSSDSVAFPSPAYNYALANLGGWINFCTRLNDDNLTWIGLDFQKLYILGECRASWEKIPGKILVERYCKGREEIRLERAGEKLPLPQVKDAMTKKAIPNFREKYSVLAISDGLTG